MRVQITHGKGEDNNYNIFKGQETQTQKGKATAEKLQSWILYRGDNEMTDEKWTELKRRNDNEKHKKNLFAPKWDCKFIREKGHVRHYECEALDAMYCAKNGNCPFYRSSLHE